MGRGIARRVGIMEVTVTQNIEDLRGRYRGSTCAVSENYEHRCMSNNWLKIHKSPMRRKPFKRKVFIMDELTEYCAEKYARTAIELGGEVIQLLNAGYGSINLFEETTEFLELKDEKLLDEKEAEIRQFLDCVGFSSEFIKEILADMSFLDKSPAWKERVILILQEYVNK